MQLHSIEPRTKKYVKEYGFLSFERKYKKLLDTGLDYLKIASQKVVHKANKFLGNKITDAVTKPNDEKIVKLNANRTNVEEIVIPLEKIDEILNKL